MPPATPTQPSPIAHPIANILFEGIPKISAACLSCAVA